MHLCQPIPQEHRTLEFPDSLHSSSSPRLEELLGVIEDTHLFKGDSMFFLFKEVFLEILKMLEDLILLLGTFIFFCL